MHYLHLYRRLVGAVIRSEMEYRASFLAELIGNLLVTGLDFAMVAILLTRFQSLGGWTLPEVVFLYGASAISFSLAELFVGEFDNFEVFIVHGEFDRVLLRPLPVVYQMFAGAFPLRRFGRLVQGCLALGVALNMLQPDWRMTQWLFLGVSLVAGMVMFMSIFVVGATLSFWSPQSHEVANIFTYGGQFMTSYPMHIYDAWLRSIFTFIVPMAFVTYYPALYLLDKPDPMGLPAWTPFLAPVIALVVFRLSVSVWRVGVRHYQSTGN